MSEYGSGSVVPDLQRSTARPRFGRRLDSAPSLTPPPSKGKLLVQKYIARMTAAWQKMGLTEAERAADVYDHWRYEPSTVLSTFDIEALRAEAEARGGRPQAPPRALSMSSLGSHRPSGGGDILRLDGYVQYAADADADAADFSADLLGEAEAIDAGAGLAGEGPEAEGALAVADGDGHPAEGAPALALL